MYSPMIPILTLLNVSGYITILISRSRISVKNVKEII